MCGCSWNRLTGGAPLTERTRLNVREFTLHPLVQKVSSTMFPDAHDEVYINKWLACTLARSHVKYICTVEH